MHAFHRMLEAIFIALIIVLGGAAPHVIEESNAGMVTAQRNCRPMLVGSSDTQWASDNCRELTFTRGTLFILCGVDPIAVRTKIGTVELPPGFAAAIQQEDGTKMRITAIGYRTRVLDPLRNTRELLVTTLDGSVYKLHPAEQLTVSLADDEITDIVTAQLAPTFYDKLRITAGQVSMVDISVELNGYELSTRIKRQSAKLLLSMLGARFSSDSDQPNIQVAWDTQFVAMQLGAFKSTKAVGAGPHKARPI